MPPSRAVTGHQKLRTAGAAVLLFFAYLLLAHVCHRFVIPPFMSALVWLPGGLTLGALLLVPREQWRLFLAVTWLAEAVSVALHGSPLPLAVLWATGTTLRTGVGAALVCRWTGDGLDLSRVRDFGGLIAFGAVIAPMASAAMGALGSMLFGGARDFWIPFVVWWSSDAMGTLLFAPLVLTWIPLPRRAAPRRLAEWAGLMLVLCATGTLAFYGNILMVLPYVPLLALIAAGIRLGPRGAATGLVLLGSIAIWQTFAGYGLYGSLSINPVYELLSVQVYLAVAAVSVLGLAAALQEKKELAKVQQLLADTAAVLAESLDYRETFRRAASLIVPASAAGFAVWVNDEEGRPECVARVGLAPDAQRQLAVALETAERKGREPDVATSTVVRALVGQEGRLGGLALAARRGRSATAQEEALTKDLARRFANALEQYRLVTELARVARLREDFIMVAAHELRTPITPLLLQLQRLRRTGTLHGSDPKLEDAVRYVKRLARLVDVLISATDVRSGRLNVNREPLDLAELVRAVVAESAGRLERAGCTPVLRLQGPVLGRWDRARLEELFTTLLSNAMKFGAGKPVEIDVWRSGDRARLVVRDHGIGIPEELAERIFSPFEQGVEAREYGGLGLGLYLAREIVDAHGGSVQSVPTSGGGATIVVDLPALKTAEQEAELHSQDPV